MEKNTELPLKTKNRATMWFWNPTPGIYPEKNIIRKDTCNPMFIALFIIAKGMDKEDVVYTIQGNVTQL